MGINFILDKINNKKIVINKKEQQKQTEDLTKEINNVEGIQTLNSNMQINNLVGSGCCRASAKDTINLEDVNTAQEIIFELSSALDNEEARCKRICLK